jgi:hypothetical protein
MPFFIACGHSHSSIIVLKVFLKIKNAPELLLTISVRMPKM